MDHQQQQQQQQNRRRAVEAGGGGQNHPLPQPCPRCHSNNTKFCYYNNYSLSQPRFFCKGCRRYWTQGGTLRNVPVGGGCRKSKRPKLASDGSGSGSCSDKQSQLPPPPPLMSPPPPHQLPNHQLILNAQDHQLSMLSTTNAASAVATTGTDTISNNTPMMMAHHNFFGGGNNNNQGFLSSLAALQGGVNVNQPLSFGSNLGLLHGFGLPNFDHQPAQPNQQQQHTQNEPLHIPYTTREIGSSSSSMPPEWTLRMQPGPAAAETETNNATENHNHNHNRIRNRNINDGDDSLSDQQWPNFLGTSGLDDP